MLMVGMETLRIPFFFDPCSSIIPGPVFGEQVTFKREDKKAFRVASSLKDWLKALGNSRAFCFPS